MSIIGVWSRGRLLDPHPDLELDARSVLVLAGTAEQIDAWNVSFCIYQRPDAPVLVIGGGRVGRAAAEALSRLEVRCTVLDRRPLPWAADLPGVSVLQGDAEDGGLLGRAGITQAPATLITTHDDNLNVFIALHCRMLSATVQVVARASAERNVSTLYRAGCDFVLSHPALVANQLFNTLERGSVLLIAEGLAALHTVVPERLAGRSLADSRIREETGCLVVAIATADGTTTTLPRPDRVLRAGERLVMTGTMDAIDRWYARHPVAPPPRPTVIPAMLRKLVQGGGVSGPR